jgi:hypothetical protein
MATFRLDSLILHLDAHSESVAALRSKAESVGYPLFTAPDSAKGDQKNLCIRVGDQQIRILGGVETGGDGCCKVTFSVKSLYALADKYRRMGIEVIGPVRAKEPGLLGIFPRRLPWKELLLPPIPGTRIVIGLIEYDQGTSKYSLTQYSAPNASELGIEGITAAHFYLPHWREALQYLTMVFEGITVFQNHACYHTPTQRLSFYSTDYDKPSVHLEAATSVPHYVAKSFCIQNLRIENVRS